MVVILVAPHRRNADTPEQVLTIKDKSLALEVMPRFALGAV
jgi:hypothetical protein